jgi:hypothetical protein
MSTSSTPTSSDGLTPDALYGTPYQDIYEWDGQQTASDDCAIRAQQFIIEQFTGQKISEQSLEQEAEKNGWYDPGQGGTPIADIGKLLQDHGIPVDTYTNATVKELGSELAQGHKVIVAVNAEDLWKFDPALAGEVQASGGQTADHAVVVSGIDTSDPNDPKVLISDPGTGEALASYPLNDFLAAWKTSDFSMVATKDPAPSSLPEMTNFDYTTGHIPEVMGMPYDEFQSLPSWWDFAAMAPETAADPYAMTETGYEPLAEEIAALESYETGYNPEMPELNAPWEHTPYA